MPLSDLQSYRPDRNEPDDFDTFWAGTLAAARRHAFNVTVTPVPTHLTTVNTFAVHFAGYDGQPIRAWLNVPAHLPQPLPAVVEYVGYGGGRGHPHDWLLYASAGYAHFVMDTRGQGSEWLTGDTPDNHPAGAPHYPGFFTRGIDTAETYYYRRLITDAVRAVDAALQLPQIDPAAVHVTGTSQGGGLAIAVGSLHDHVAAVLAAVPFLCDIRRASTVADTGPYLELARYLSVHVDRVDTVFQDVLDYVDAVNFAARARCPALFSACLMDSVCPPSTVFAAYNHYSGPKSIRVYPYNGHDGAAAEHALACLDFLSRTRT